MKTLKILFSVLLLSVFVTSCSSDDDNSTKVKYEIVGLDSSVTEIKYKKGNGSVVTLNNFEDFAGGNSSKTVSVSDYPFTANLEVTANNTSSSTKTYTLAITVNGVPEDFTPLVVPANSTATAVVDFVIETE
ncbi:hypothetical protein [Flavobacterium terrisoli]|uniref:hypothetical protein n=1 Tax=Flavobacterium terrisoli TaxID=3242195 RepID=UPI0025430C38|nr:hypothetical protein [Flavobacterium buctense]